MKVEVKSVRWGKRDVIATFDTEELARKAILEYGFNHNKAHDLYYLGKYEECSKMILRIDKRIESRHNKLFKESVEVFKKYQNMYIEKEGQF